MKEGAETKAKSLPKILQTSKSPSSSKSITLLNQDYFCVTKKLEVAVVFVCIVYIYTLLFILAIEECNEFFYQYKKPRIARPIFIGAMFEMNAMMLQMI